jgi:hypothetical protein
LGAILLILGGLGLFMVDSRNHPGTAQAVITRSP